MPNEPAVSAYSASGSRPGGVACGAGDDGILTNIQGMKREDGRLVFTPATSASALVFFVLARYRLPGMVILMPFAGMAVVRIYDAVRAREHALVVGSLAATALFAAFVAQHSF